MSFGHGGNIYALAKKANCKPEEIIDFSANINPLGPAPSLRAAVSIALNEIHHYPDPFNNELIETISETYGCPSDEITVGNGSTELIYALPKLLNIERALIAVPCYIDYEKALNKAKIPIDYFELKEEEGFTINWKRLSAQLKGNEAVFLARPNNPTGISFKTSDLLTVANKHQSTTFVIDEAFMDFLGDDFSLIHPTRHNIIVLRSLTKFHAIPGIRLGMCIATPAFTARLREVLPPWSVNTIAQKVGIQMLKDIEYATETRSYVDKQRREMSEAFKLIPSIKAFAGEADFFLIKILTKTTANELATKLLKKYKIAIRVCANYQGLNQQFFRVAIKTKQNNQTLILALKGEFLADISIPLVKKRPALMIQGTASDAGKSVLNAAFCRILFQDGLKVAPFKAQNMSLNSFVTQEGLEMGRAQVTQAQACKIEPDVRMNPILLKPNSHTGSQVIIEGKPIGNMNVKTYFEYKKLAAQKVHECYDSLSAEYDAVILEGAGSPAEVNLKKHDIVNMNMARYAQSPVLIAGDIDRGGLFASFIGTMQTLNHWERDLVAGFLINRFRGDASLLSDAMDITYSYTGKPTLGVIPFLQNLGLPEEDSVSFKASVNAVKQAKSEQVSITVIDLPHISNFTDLDALGAEPDVFLQVIDSPRPNEIPDAIIIPGSKNVIHDLAFLKKTGMADWIGQLARNGKTKIVGICGGFQMMGKTISDPLSIETAFSSIQGLSFLDLTTTLAEEKMLKQTTAIHQESGLEVKGYEIHHGQTKGTAKSIFKNGKNICGFSSKDGNIWGTYLHGVFDADAFRRHFIDQLRIEKGLPPLKAIQTVYNIDLALDRLADTVREAVDMNQIYQIMGI